MGDKRNVLDLFEAQKDFVEEKISSGIEQHRKGSGKIKIVHKDGKPVAGIKVRLTQKSHQFRFGANLFMLDELETEDEHLQAEIIEKLYSIWFSHPNVEQIIYWNLVDGYAHLWDPDPVKIAASQGNMTIGENYYYGGLLRFDLSPKPAYLKIKELIQERWHTELEIVTDKDGCADFRGFYGDYEVAVGNDTQTLSHLKNQENIHTLTI